MNQGVRIAMKSFLTLIVFLATAASNAQPGPLPPQEIMKQNDLNKDGKITKVEAKKAGTPLAKIFDLVDGNKDGVITLAELSN